MKKLLFPVILISMILGWSSIASAFNPARIVAMIPPPPDTVTMVISLGNLDCDYLHCGGWTLTFSQIVGGVESTIGSMTYPGTDPIVSGPLLVNPSATDLCVTWQYSGTSCTPTPPVTYRKCCKHYSGGGGYFFITCSPCKV
jgi:hypothetical protein